MSGQPDPGDRTVADLFGLALQQHQAGRLAEAEALYRQALARNPDHADSLHYLGILAHQVGRNDIAVELIAKAVAVFDAEPIMHRNLGIVLQALRRPTEAEAAFRRAITLKPDYADPYNKLGDALHGQGRFEEAIGAYRRAIALEPAFLEAYNSLGNTCLAAGDLKEAETTFVLATQLAPDHAEARNGLGGVFWRQGRRVEAVAAFRRAIELKRDYAAAYSNLGVALWQEGELDEATAAYRSALDLNPDLVEAHCNLGNVLRDQGRCDEAAAACRRAIALRPDYAEAHNNLGAILWDMRRFEEALKHCRRALELKPNFAEADNNLGNLLKEGGRLDEATSSYKRAITLKPDYADAHNNLGMVLMTKGRLAEADNHFQLAAASAPKFAAPVSNRLFALNYAPDKTAEEIYRAYELYGDASKEDRPRGAVPSVRKSGKLRIGYVSADFKGHAVRNFLEPVLEGRDRSGFDVHAYAENVIEDDVTALYRANVDHWTPTKPLSDAQLAERIRADGIDVLVDLAGHTAGNRLGMFALKPAPVSVSWLGTGYTTGLRAIDYILADATTAPEGSEDLFSEAPWRLPTAYVYRAAATMGEPGPLPALAKRHVTFGTLTRAIRLNAHTIRVWSELLKRVAGSRLMINSQDFQHPSMQDEFAGRFAAHGIGRDRLEIGFDSPPWDLLRGIDISLDCFPHNSGTTLFESLYMGSPFVTLAGRPSVGLIGSSILRGLGRPEWIARSEAEYVEIAAGLASDLSALAEIRSSLRGQMQASPLMDQTGFVRSLEAAYRAMADRLTG